MLSIYRNSEWELLRDCKIYESLTRLHAAIQERVWPAVAPALEAIAALGIAWYLNAAILRCQAATYFPYIQIGLATAAIGLAAKIAWQLFASWQGKSPSAPSFHVEKQLAGFSIVNAITQIGFNILIHELGHAAAAALCYKRPSIQITLQPFIGGSTSYTIFYGLTRFGHLIGKRNAAILCIIGGIASASIFSSLELYAASRIPAKDSSFSANLLTWHSLSLLYNNTLYALSAFYAHKSDHVNDFVALWQQYGIHPLVAITAMVAMPLLQLGLKNLQQKAASVNCVSRI